MLAERLTLLVVFVCCLAIGNGLKLHAGGCPCSDPSYCKQVTAPYRKEVLGYAVNLTNYRQFNWTKLTTVVVYESSIKEIGVELVCLAHKHTTRVLIATSISQDDLLSATKRTANIQYYFKLATLYYMDGANIDIELATKSFELRNAFTDYVKETKETYSASYPNSFVVTDVFWLPNIYHDVWAIANYSDFLFIMAYDEQAAMLPPCVARANSPLLRTRIGAELFKAVGIPGHKLILGLPWYGYLYECKKLDMDRWCYIDREENHCTQTVGSEIAYRDIRNIIPRAIDGKQWSFLYQSPYLTYKGPNTTNQIWFDDARSLRLKYDLADELDLRGVGVWTLDSLNYANSSDPSTKQMWDALPDYV